MKQPNIIQIILHDLGRHLNCYGWDSVASPNIDKLARQGVKFNKAFCTSPLCSPSRGSIITGRYPHSNGLIGLAHRGWRLHPEERTLPQLLSQSGYDTLLFGLQHETIHGNAKTLGYRYTWEEKVSGPEVTEKFTEWLLGEKMDKPFFASIGFGLVHRPHSNGIYEAEAPQKVTVPNYLPDIPEVRKDLAAYEALIKEADDAVYKILTAIEEAGITGETLVLFTTDHGTDMPRAKSSLYDPGIEVALVVRYPEVIKAGKQYDCLISNIDILPTLLDAASIKIPEKVQGKSFWNLLKDTRYHPREEIYAERTWHGTYDPVRCIRTQRYKLIHNFRPGKPPLVSPEFIEAVGVIQTEKFFAKSRPEFELYDLANDPDELTNLYGDGKHEKEEDQLKSRINKFLKDTVDPILKGDIPHPGRHNDVWDWRKTDSAWKLYNNK